MLTPSYCLTATATLRWGSSASPAYFLVTASWTASGAVTLAPLIFNRQLTQPDTLTVMPSLLSLWLYPNDAASRQLCDWLSLCLRGAVDDTPHFLLSCSAYYECRMNLFASFRLAGGPRTTIAHQIIRTCTEHQRTLTFCCVLNICQDSCRTLCYRNLLQTIVGVSSCIILSVCLLFLSRFFCFLWG